ncbi:MAG: FAD-dependent oxidoreductase [Lachnospiraceae bacterium]
MRQIKKQYDFVVVGGGLSGLCTALAAARHGVNTALVQNRAMLGGNASSEIRVHINGAGRGNGFRNAIESGIILELLMANKAVNPQNSYHVFDQVLWEKANFQENLDLYLNTHMHAVRMDGSKVASITAVQNTTETEYIFEAPLFADTTGDATLAELAGADYIIGREGQDVYGESLAPKVSDGHTMGNTVMFTTKDMGKPTPFKLPDWAYKMTKERLGNRHIGELSPGYWWIELGGDHRSIISDGANIQTELLKYVYGVFDYIKTCGEFDADNLALDWITSIPGKRESRRVYGDYMFTQLDIEAKKRFEDAIAYGGWTMDAHSVGGIEAVDSEEGGTIWHPVDDVYTIPYRSVYSRNVENLYVGGRAISASHMAMSSSRVMSTLAVVGQAIGTAASIAVEKNITPREVMTYIKELQQMLIKDDCYLPGIVAADADDLVANKDCVITASSYIEGGEPTGINGDYARRVDEEQHAWISEAMTDAPEWMHIQFKQSVTIGDMILRFDPNFEKVMFVTQSVNTMEKQDPGLPTVLVKDYTVELLKDGVVLKTIDVSDNTQRVNQHVLEEKVVCDAVKITVKSTYGDAHARVFDVRVYE